MGGPDDVELEEDAGGGAGAGWVGAFGGALNCSRTSRSCAELDEAARDAGFRCYAPSRSSRSSSSTVVFGGAAIVGVTGCLIVYSKLEASRCFAPVRTESW